MYLNTLVISHLLFVLMQLEKMGKCQEHVTNYDFACFLSLTKTFATLPPSCILSLMAIVHNNSGQFVRSLYFFFLFDLTGQLESKNFSTQNLSHILTAEIIKLSAIPPADLAVLKF